MSDWSLFRSALRDLLRPRRLGVTLVLLALPGLVAFLWRLLATPGKFDPDEVYGSLGSLMVYGFTLPILAVIYGTGVLSQEIEGRTIVYLLTRPMPRWRILLAKFAAAWVIITLTVALSAVFLAFGTFGSSVDTIALFDDLKILPVGALAYGILSLLLATVLNRPIIYGLLIAFGWETIVPRLPGAFSRLSILSYLRALAPHLNEASQTAAPSASGPTNFLLAAATPPPIPVLQAWLTLIGFIVVALAAALYFFSTREYVPREDAA